MTASTFLRQASRPSLAIASRQAFSGTQALSRALSSATNSPTALNTRTSRPMKTLLSPYVALRSVRAQPGVPKAATMRQPVAISGFHQGWGLQRSVQGQPTSILAARPSSVRELPTRLHAATELQSKVAAGARLKLCWPILLDYTASLGGI